MRHLASIAFLCLVMPGWQVAQAETPLAAFPVNEESIARIQKQHQLASGEVDDPVYKRKQRYQGIWLRDVLSDLGQAHQQQSDLYVRFRCKDGYLPIMPLSRALGAKGLIAVRDLNAPAGSNWQPVPGSNPSSTPAPSYLVWITPHADPDEYPWPYQMVAIEIVSSSEALGGLDVGAAKSGFNLFVTHCLKCHAINGIGGRFGPELNSPCSVTEYWNPRLLARFISNSSSVRAETKMPDFSSLKETEVRELIEYLQSAARHKKPGAACP